MPETTLLHAALFAYVVAWVSGWRRVGAGATRGGAMAVALWGTRTVSVDASDDGPVDLVAPQAALSWLVLALVLHTISLAWRWSVLGHGPFTTMYEILSSSLWSLSLVVAAASLASPLARASMHYAFPVTALLASWMLLADPSPGHLPATYDTVLLYLHTIVGKIFLGLLLVATAVAFHAARVGESARSARGDKRAADASALVHRLAGLALVFDTLLLSVGAVWAMDAWGRYWAWDPLETWSFLTWLALVATLHARVTYRPSPRVLAACLAGVFVLAFLTFFGVPYLSTSPHKGAI